MPANDYNDPELEFPRLQARIQRLAADSFWLQVWAREKAGAERRALVNGKRAGSREDAHEIIREIAQREGLPIPGADDIEVD
jgi:hypothetical protein